MESDKKKQFKTVIEYFAYAAIVIQTAFAAFWLFKNIGVTEPDYVAHTYILAAESLKVDDSMGILYALLIRLVGHGAVLQILQHVVLTVSVFFFSLTLLGTKAGVILALMVSYNPFILQAETAVSPNAMVLACSLFAIAATVKVFKDKRWILGLFCATVIVGFLNPDYAYIFLIAEVPFVCVMCIRRKRFELLLTAVCLVGVAVPVIVNGAVRDDYAYGRVHRSVDFLKMQRIAWPNTYYNYEFMNAFEGYILGNSDTDYEPIMREADKIPENLALVFANGCEERIGVDYAKAAYRELTARTFDKGFSYWGKPIVRDMMLYVFSPVSSAKAFLRQETDTSIPSGLGLLFEESPGLFRIYYLFSAAAGLLLVLLYAASGIFADRKSHGKVMALSLLGIILLISLYATFVCLREYDYRNVLFMVVGWPAAAMALTERRKTL